VIRLILSWYTGVCAALVLIVQGLSVFHLIMPLPFFIGAAAVALATAAMMKMPRPGSYSDAALLPPAKGLRTLPIGLTP
jgi:hypothetical protein